MNLSDIYPRLIALRPELAVEGLSKTDGPYWYRRKSEGNGDYFTDEEATDLFVVKMIKNLPAWHELFHQHDGWLVMEDHCVIVPGESSHPTPLSALANFWESRKA